jgi:hypothetical protein
MSFDRLCKTLIAPCVFAGALQLLPAPALSQTAPQPNLFRTGLQLAQYRECQQRVGPFATQSTAWQRWRDAQGQGYSVSNGVVPCFEDGARGYCFFAFYRC